MTKPTGTVKRRTDAPEAPPALNIVKPGAASLMRGVLFGPPKTGKTVAAVSGEGRKLLVLVEPDGDLPLVGRDDVDVVKPESAKEIDDVLRFLHTGGAEQYQRVVWDSVTFMIEMIGGKDINDTIKANKEVRRVYQKVGARVGQIVHDALAVKVDNIFLTQLKHEEADDGEDPLNPSEGEYPVGMAITPMVRRALEPAVSFIGRTYKRMVVANGNKRVQYMVSFEDYGRSPAGSRIGLDPVIENLDLDVIKAIITGGSNGNS